MACMDEYTWSRTVSVDAALGQTFCTPTPRRAPPLLTGHSAGVFEFCSGLVDLVVGVGRHGGGGHGFALAGERFVGLVAKDIAEVGDRGGDLRDPSCSEGIERITGDGRGGLIVFESVQEGGERRQGDMDNGGVAAVVVVADRQCE